MLNGIFGSENLDCPLFSLKCTQNGFKIAVNQDYFIIDHLVYFRRWLYWYHSHTRVKNKYLIMNFKKTCLQNEMSYLESDFENSIYVSRIELIPDLSPYLVMGTTNNGFINDWVFLWTKNNLTQRFITTRKFLVQK